MKRLEYHQCSQFKGLLQFISRPKYCRDQSGSIGRSLGFLVRYEILTQNLPATRKLATSTRAKRRESDIPRTTLWGEVKKAVLWRLENARGNVTADLIEYGVGLDPICQSGPFARYKDALVPRCFSNYSLLLFWFLPLSHLSAPPLRASSRTELHLPPCQAP